MGESAIGFSSLKPTSIFAWLQNRMAKPYTTPFSTDDSVPQLERYK